jgi:hypothetical protein
MRSKEFKFLLLLCVHILNKETDTVDVLTSSTPVGEIGSVQKPSIQYPFPVYHGIRPLRHPLLKQK